jgi:hypothetical protein
MKKLTLIFTALLFVTGFAANAQDGKTPAAPKPKVFAVVNRANWCTVCKENGQRAGMVLGSYVPKGIAIVMNDLTDKTTSGVSKTSLKKHGLYAAVSNEQATGVITFVDASTKKKIKTISIAENDEKLKSEIDGILSTTK